MNLIFHVIASCALLLLVYLLIHVQKDREFLRLLLRIAAGEKAATSKITVDWPLKYLVEFSRCLGISIDGTGPLNIGEPRKIDTNKIIQVYLNQGIRSITYTSSSQDFPEPQATFLLGKPSQNRTQDVQDLEQSLKIKCQVQYEKDESN
jgi:hypothetical protein